MRARIILTEEQASAIRRAALQAYPRECCGLLIGDGDAVVRVIPTPNIARDPAGHFEIDPQTLFDHFRSARETNMRMMGHYHSHPNGREEPSGEDLRMAHDPDAVWIIAAVNGDVVSLRAFAPPPLPEGGRFREIPLDA